VPAIPLGRRAFKRAGLSPISLKNYYFESAPTNLEDQVSLRPRPRLARFAEVGSGPIRGLYREGGVIGGAIICRSGNSLYKVNQTTGASTLIGEVDGTARMSAEGSTAYVVLACGASVYRTDGTALETIAIPDDLPVNAVDTLDQRFLFPIQASNMYMWTPPGEYTVDGADFASAESQPDVLITLKVIDDVLWLIGRLSLEPWQPTGDQDLPYKRIEGRVFGIGCTARDTCQKMNVDGLDTMCWVGTDRKVYRLDPNPVRISDPGLEEALFRATPEDLYGHHAVWQGHDFYVLHIPGEGSFAYDLTTRAGWADWTSYGRELFRTGVSTIGVNGEALLGDNTSNVIYRLTEDDNTDDGDPVVFEFSGLLEVPGSPVPCRNVILIGQTGTAATPSDDPLMQLAYSDDHGKTYIDVPPQPLGRQANWTLRVAWTRLGMLRRECGRIFRWRTTEPVVIQKAKFNEGLR
jgi:hypothetical protein